MKRLQDKVCIVTGAASGIGRETVKMFVSEGAEVHGLDLNKVGLADLNRSEPTCITHEIDITDGNQIQSAIELFHRIDVLFNCAGRVSVGSILDCSDNDWTLSLQTNVTSIYELTRAVLPIMLTNGGGSIINMASVISSIGGAPERFAYGATKGAVIGITKSIARDFADRGIRCNAICPSAVETPTMRQRIDAMDNPESAREMFNSRQPIGRMGTTDEIAYLATYLASDESKFVTGSAMVIDGGAKL